MSEATRPPEPERERPPEVHVGQSAVRCPFCHEDVQVAEPDWVACAGCLARHHGACWAESGRCGGCKGTESLARTAGPSAAPSKPPPDPDTLGRWVPWSGAPRELRFTRTVDGELDGSVDEVVVTEIRKRLGLLGRVERLGSTLTWTTRGSGGEQQGRLVTVTVSSRDGRTTLDVHEDYHHQVLGARIVGFVFGVMGATFAAALVAALFHDLARSTVAAAVGGTLAAVTALVLVLLFARFMVVKPYRHRRPQLAELTDVLERELRARVRRQDPKAQ